MRYHPRHYSSIPVLPRLAGDTPFDEEEADFQAEEDDLENEPDPDEDVDYDEEDE